MYLKKMNKWSDINPPKPLPKKEDKPKETDWLEEANAIKRKCRIKTKTARVIYPPFNSIKVKDYTETYLKI